MRRLAALVVLGIVALVQPLAGRASASVDTTSVEQQFVAKINDLRASKGLGQLTVDAQLTSIARAWSANMAKAGAISHNPNLGTQVTESWVKLGENVGTGADVSTLFQAFVNSPHHYANLVDPAFTHLGVGVVISADGTIWTSHEFMQLGAAPVAAPAPRVAKPAAAPLPVHAAAPAPAAAAAPVAAAHAAPAPAPAPVKVLGPDHIVQSMEQLRSFDL